MEGQASWELRSMRQEMLLTVTPLRREGSDEIEATGFFYAFEAKKYLITCYHVVQCLRSSSDKWTAKVHLDGGPASSSSSPKNGPQQQQSRSVLKERAGVISFSVPEDVIFCPSADLCAVEIQDKIASQIKDTVIFRTIDAGRVAMEQSPFWESSMDIGLNVFLPGYPKGLSDTYHHLPLVRSGTLAFDPSLGWNGDASLGVVNMTVFRGDSGAPLFWQGQAFQLVEKVPDPKQTKKRGQRVQGEHQFVAIPQDDLKLVGVHCGGYEQHAEKIDMGVYVKVAELAKGFSSWPKMETLESVGYAHPHESRSKHTLHASGNLFSVPSNLKPSSFDSFLFEKVGGSRSEYCLIEKRVGRFWTLSFNEGGVLRSLATADCVYNRTESDAVGGPIDHECLRFVGKKSASGTFDAVFLFRVYANSRSDGVVLSGVICSDLEPGESYVSNQSSIAWIWKGGTV